MNPYNPSSNGQHADDQPHFNGNGHYPQNPPLRHADITRHFEHADPASPSDSPLGPPRAPHPAPLVPTPASYLALADPADFIDTQLAARLDTLAARLHKSQQAEPVDIRDAAWLRYEAHVDRTFRATLAQWLRYRRQRDQDAGSHPHASTVKPKKRAKSTPSETTESPPTTDISQPPHAAAPDPASPLPEIIEPPCPADWQDRLVIDPSVNGEWPLVRGTRVWADHVAAMLEDGWSLALIITRYPDLTPEDIAACRYADSQRLCGPWPGGVPPEPRPRDQFPNLPDDDW